MDLERIKQNFRIRSGRSKPKKKPAKKANPPSELQKSAQQSQSLPNGHTSEGEQAKQESKEQEQKVEQPSASLPSEHTAEEEHAEDTVAVGDTQEAAEHPDLLPDSVSEHVPSTPHVTEDTADAAEQEDDADKPDPDPNSQEMSHTMDEPDPSTAYLSSDAEDFDLSPPKPRSKPPSLESLSELLFSSDHLNALLHNSSQLTNFSTFLQKYVPETYPLLSQYLETQKAIRAVEYANAVAYGFKPENIGDGAPTEVRNSAATLDPDFRAVCDAAFEALVGRALPQYISYQLIKICSECLTNEIIGHRSTVIMRDLVGGLSEVFCLTDPNQEDNPIIYASEEFYRLTGYGEEDVIGNNCRFLQGRKTNPASPKRIKEAVEKGEEISETLLNYRRDGRPFINVLMIAPLYDKNNKVKYHIGAQVDVSGLVEGGRALPGFQHFLNRRGQDQQRQQREKNRNYPDSEQQRKSRALARLRDLSEMFDLEESAVVRETSRANSLTREDEENRSTMSAERQRTPRRVLAESDDEDDEDSAKEEENDGLDWKLGASGDGKLSGKLPGIYDSFMLVRPYPSLRIVFLSPKLRKYNDVLQTPMLSHIAAPVGILGGLAESLKSGVPVYAKVHFMPERGVNREGTKLKRGAKHEDGKHGKAIWISCTPLVGSDDRVGVWMCVVVEKSKVAGMKESRMPLEQSADRPFESFNGQPDSKKPAEEQTDQSQGTKSSQNDVASREHTQNQPAPAGKDIPIKPVRMNSQTVIKGVTEQLPETPTRRITDSRKAESHEEANLRSTTDDDNDSTRTPDTKTTEPNDSLRSGGSGQDDSEDPAATSDEEILQSSEASKPYSVDLPDYGTATHEDHESQTDEYVTTRSTIPSAQPNDRVLIMDDSDVFTDDHIKKDQPEEQDRSSSASPVWSPASEVPPSIPSDAQSSNGEEPYTEDSASQNREPVQSSDRPAATDEDEGASDTVEENDQTNESATTPTQPPATPQRGSQSLEQDEEDETLVSSNRTDSYFEHDSRPTTAVDTSSSTRMDYLKAGSGRWQQGRNPRRVDLTQENFQLSGLEHRAEDGWYSDVECARSPYSVD